MHGVVATTIAWAPATRRLGADLCGPRHGSREVWPNEGGGRWVGGHLAGSGGNGAQEGEAEGG